MPAESGKARLAYQEQFEQLRCCVLVPTYNNEHTLAAVINSILEYTDHIIVVDDGSTDSTSEILQNAKPRACITIPKNRGKGYALRKGLMQAAQSGYENAISMDSDGQHFASDLPAFLNKLKEHDQTLYVGARNMDAAGAPGKSNFGFRFSNFWYTVTTGIKLPDTQCGYRLYPLKELTKMRFFTHRFEFEIEVLVRAAWKKIPVKAVPVKVYYPPSEKRVSHFRPFTDFFRISLLNTLLVLLALLYYRPYLFFSRLTWKSFKGFVRKELFNPNESNGVKVASVMVGAFMGVAPVWGWQMAIALGIAIAFRLNKIIVLAVSNISIPPMIPFILYLSYITGGILLGRGAGIPFDSNITLAFVTDNLLQYILGSLVFGVILAMVLGLVTYLALLLFRKQSPSGNRKKNTER
jgi:glycosyltransferase involved in cell wall biosynthesis